MLPCQISTSSFVVPSRVKLGASFLKQCSGLVEGLGFGLGWLSLEGSLIIFLRFRFRPAVDRSFPMDPADREIFNYEA